TASNIQVRKPLYTSSIGRAKHFEAQLAPLAAALEANPAIINVTQPSRVQPEGDHAGGPDTAERRMAAGEAARQRGEPASAQAEFDTALALAPESADARYQLARLASETGDFERAEILLREALDRNPRLYPAWEELSLIKAQTSPATLVKELDTAIPAAQAD